MNISKWLIFCLCIFLINCTEKTAPISPSPVQPNKEFLEVPNIQQHKSDLFFNRQKSVWTMNDSLYSGYALSYHQNGELKEKFGVLNGRKQNQATQWYADGHYQYLSHYHKGKLHGAKKAWTPDSLHILVSHLNYVSGKPHGEQKKWYPTGELFKKLNLNMGKEEGLQQAFRENGVLYANYEVREGRIFGLKSASLCFGIEDKSIQYKR